MLEAEVKNPDGVTSSDGAADETIAMPALVPVQALAVLDIDDSGRLRPVDSVAAQAIAASMAKDGLINAIDVCRMPGQSGYRLVCGGHRLAAAKLLGWATIPAVVRSANALERRSREIAENFFRAEMSPIDQARFVSELIDNEKARLGLAPEQDGRAHNSRKVSKKETLNDLRILRNSFGLQDAVASKLGLSQQEVSRKLALNGIAPSFLDRVRALPMASNASALRKLASLEWMKQDEALVLLEGGKAKDMGHAVAILNKHAVPDPKKKRLSTLLGTFSRMGRKEKLAALSALAGLMPTGAEIVFTSPAERMQAASDAAALMHKVVVGDGEDGGEEEEAPSGATSRATSPAIAGEEKVKRPPLGQYKTAEAAE